MSIDWTKPLELTDGTPVRLEAHDADEEAMLTNGPDGTPDSEGTYWVIRDDGKPFYDNIYSICVPHWGSRSSIMIKIRNRD